jgi:hypothetical protein
VEHLTLQCSFSREVWYHLLLPLRMHRHTPSTEDCLDTWWPALSNAISKNHRKEVNTLVILVARELWLERNSRVFDKMAVLPAELVRRIKAEFLLWKQPSCAKVEIREESRRQQERGTVADVSSPLCSLL